MVCAMRAALALVLLAGCSSPPPARPTGPTNALVAARPYDMNVPASYDPSKPTPVVVMLHGYSATPFLEEGIYQLTPLSESRNFLYVTPSGTSDKTGAPFWNATDACCDLYGSNVDDVGYLNAVLDDVEARFNVDKKRIFFTGHSNGGFMSHRMACDASDRIAAIVSLAGAVWLDASKCNPIVPVPVLEVHGDADTEVPYNGSMSVPSAPQTVATWAAKDGCHDELVDTGMTLDLDTSLPGAETSISAHQCSGHAAAELWTIHGGSHVPNFAHPDWGNDILDWMFARAKP
jgi:polyhydroxybutyrate depolymerase